MKLKGLISLFAVLQFGAFTAEACTFSWHTIGSNKIRDRLEKKIGELVTDEYCNKLNKGHELVIMFDSYSNSKMSLGHASVGIRRRGDREFPTMRMSAYRSDQGNYTQAYAMDLATSAAADAITEVMADLDSYAPAKK